MRGTAVAGGFADQLLAKPPTTEQRCRKEPLAPAYHARTCSVKNSFTAGDKTGFTRMSAAEAQRTSLS